MKELLKNYTAGSLICAAVGVLLLIEPHIVTDLLNTVIGVVLIVWGALGLARCFSEKTERDTNVFALLGNAVLVLGGIYVFKHPDLLEKVLMTALGIYLILSGLPKVIDSLRIRREGGSWVKPFAVSCVTTLLGGLVLFLPALIPGIVMRVIGGLLVAGAVGNFISGRSSGKILDGIERISDDHAYRRGKAAEQKGSVVDITDFHED